jgi:hypothetical protein
LSRHFRSEAGRNCTKPLLDEEAIKWQAQYNKQQESTVAATETFKSNIRQLNNPLPGVSSLPAMQSSLGTSDGNTKL